MDCPLSASTAQVHGCQRAADSGEVQRQMGSLIVVLPKFWQTEFGREGRCFTKWAPFPKPFCLWAFKTRRHPLQLPGGLICSSACHFSVGNRGTFGASGSLPCSGQNDQFLWSFPPFPLLHFLPETAISAGHTGQEAQSQQILPLANATGGSWPLRSAFPLN